MPNWRHIVESNHAWAHPDDDCQLVVRPPATAEDLASLDTVFGPAMSCEMRSFYEQMDGLGVATGPDGVSWFVSPIATLPDLIDHCRSWFRDTHPDLAARFFPFIDWGCGDYTGFLLSENGTLLVGLYTFEHEDYEFEEWQDADEFIYSVFTTIEELLIPE